jgi:TonB family protein
MGWTAVWAQGTLPAPHMPMPGPPPDFSYNRMMPQASAPEDQKRTVPVAIYQARPEYPMDAAVLGIEGQVIVEFTVTSAGTVSGVFAVRSTSSILEPAAVAAVSRWIFRPAKVNGRAVNTRMQIPLIFSLPRGAQKAAQARLPKDAPARPVFQIAPTYPAAAGMVGADGEVIVDFKVTVDGYVKGARAVRSTQKVFEAPAVSAVSRWRFIPARAKGKMIETRVQVPVVFHLSPDARAAMAMKNEVNIALPFADEDKRPPLLPLEPRPVYPFAALLENRRATLVGEVEFDAAGQPGAARWESPPPREFAEAVAAMLEARAGMKDAIKLSGRHRLRFEFDPHDGNVRVSDAAAAILKRLRTEGDAAKFTLPSELDQPLAAVAQPAPVFPWSLRGKIKTGEATVEFFVDAAGRVQLPRVVAGTAPEFGLAACQAVAGWRYRPPAKGGEAVVVKTQATLTFEAGPGT